MAARIETEHEVVARAAALCVAAQAGVSLVRELRTTNQRFAERCTVRPSSSAVRESMVCANVAADVSGAINIHGASATVTVTGVHFKTFTAQGKPIGQSR